MTSIAPQLSFMAILTLLLLASVQGASIYLLTTDDITGREYLAIWVPMVTLAVGFWFGRQGATQ